MLNAGLTHEATYAVTPDMRPPHLAGILSTSRMISLIEDTCIAVVHPLLDHGQTTVGTRVDVTHVGTAWTGEERQDTDAFPSRGLHDVAMGFSA